MVRLYEISAARGVEILAVSQDADPAAVRAFAQRYGVRFPLFMDPEKKVYRLYRATGVPETHLIDKNGTLVRSWIGGFDWTGEDVVRSVRTLLSR